MKRDRSCGSAPKAGSSRALQTGALASPPRPHTQCHQALSSSYRTTGKVSLQALALLRRKSHSSGVATPHIHSHWTSGREMAGGGSLVHTHRGTLSTLGRDHSFTIFFPLQNVSQTGSLLLSALRTVRQMPALPALLIHLWSQTWESRSGPKRPRVMDCMDGFGQFSPSFPLVYPDAPQLQPLEMPVSLSLIPEQSV